MSEDFVFALLLLAVGVAIIWIGGYSVYRQKLYYDPKDKSVVTEVEIPIIGKLKTNAPSLALCFVGLVPVFLAQAQMKARNPTLVKFEGEIGIDPTSAAGINAVMVGVTSGLWSETETPDTGAATLKVAISVPDSWPSYTAYAFALGGTQTRPSIIGTTLEDRTFKLKIAP
jgi:hypothetical protein